MEDGTSDVSAVAEDVWDGGHEIDFQSVSGLAHVPNIHLHLVQESCTGTDV